MNAIDPAYRSYTGLRPAPPDTSLDAAVARAARDTLAALFPSQAASFDAALAEDLLRLATRGRDRGATDEFNGVTLDNQGQVRTRVERSFASLSAAEEENGQSRIYLGIHWSFDKTEGIAQGRRVADWVFDNTFQPL